MTGKVTAAALRQLERFAELQERIAKADAWRSSYIAGINAKADAEIAPLAKERDAVAARIEDWFGRVGKDLLPKGRKSMELGGCMIGSRTAKARLAHSFESDEKAAEALRGTRYGNQTTRVKYGIDRVATLKLLEINGKSGQAIAALGFSIAPAVETVFIERVAQAGTIGAAS